MRAGPGKRLLWLSLGAVALVGGGCASFQRWVGRVGLEDYADELAAQPEPKAFDAFVPFLLPEATAPLSVTPVVGGAPRFSLDDDAVVEEVLRFPSRVSPDARVGMATYYVYRKGPLGQRPVVLWLPGNGYGWLAFQLVAGQYEAILAAGYDLLVWVPPQHLEREAEGQAGVFNADTAENVRTLLACVQEQRTVLAALRARGVPTVGGWGGRWAQRCCG